LVPNELDPAADAEQSHVPIARFASIAEAGYFHSELEGRLGCEIRLLAQNDFDAPSASWSNCFVLTAPARDAEPARELLKQIVVETDQPEVPVEQDVPLPPLEFRPAEQSAPESRIHWAPIVLTLTAGTFVIWAARQAPRQGREPARGKADQVDVWKHLSGDGVPWVQQLMNGRGKRELLIDPDGEGASLREDRDGDGVFEHSSRLMFAPAE
jgi:hypothetical protein